MSDVGPAIYICPTVALAPVAGGVLWGLVREGESDPFDRFLAHDLILLILPVWVGYKIGRWWKGRDK